MKENLTITFLNPTKQVRTTIQVLSKELLSNGHDVNIISPEDSDYSGEANFIPYNAKYVPGVRYTLPSAGLIHKLIKYSKKSDVVHICGYFYLPSSIAVFIAEIFSESILTVDSLPGIRWSYGNSIVDQIAKTYTSTIGKCVFSKTSSIICLGEYLVDPIKKFSVEPLVIPNGIHIKDIQCAKKTNNDRIQLLYVGRLDPVKGVEYLLESFKSLNENKYELVLVGDGTNRRKYEKMAKKLGIDQDVVFEGWENNVTPFYENSDIFVLPSISEGQPTVLLEAQAAGLPVIATNVGGVNEIIIEGKVIDPKCPDKLAKAIEEVSSNDSTKGKKEIRKGIIDKYSAQKMYESYIKIYKKLSCSNARNK